MAECASKFGILPHIQFNTRVESAEWLEEEARWRLLTSAGEELLCSVLVHAGGMLHEPAYPQFGGEEVFTGEILHTARWDKEVDLTNKVSLRLQEQV